MVLRCGAAKEKISPPNDVGDTYIAGYLTMEAPKVKGVHDPIHARAIVLSDGDQKFALVSVEVIGLLADFVNRIKNRLSAYGFSYKNVYIFSTHTHAGPDTMGLWGPIIGKSGINEKYMIFLLDTIVEIVLEAEKELVETDIYVTKSEIPELIENYRIKENVDGNLLLMKFLSDENLIASLWTYTAQPEITTRENLSISADYPGLVSEMIEAEYGGTSLFALGLCGAQSPIYCEEGFDKMDIFADKIFSEIKKIYDDHKKIKISPIEIRYREVKLQLENPDFQLLYTLGILDREYEDERIKSSVSKIRIGDLDLLNIPGEPFPGLLSDIIDEQDNKEIIVLSHSNDSIGYFIPKNQWSLKPQIWVDDIVDGKFIGHETESIGVKAGQIIRKAIKELFHYKTVLAIGPHADDLTIWAGGTLIKLTKEGNDLICVRITDDYADCVGLTEEKGRRRNKKETERAYKALGAKEIVNLGYPTDTLYTADYHELRGKLVGLMRKYKPDLVVSFDLNGNDEENMDHITTARAVNEACWQSSFDLFYPEHFEEGLDIHAVGERYLFARNPTILNFYVDITDHIDDKIKAINYQKTVMENWFYQNKLLARANNLYVELLEEDVPNPIRVTLLVKLVYGEIGEKYGVKYAEEFNRIDAGMLKDLAED
ncbi:MAG: hypothetical protein BAJALOKI3v1_80002 [Promethearchaeota archaeon]|jgi:LmbE family N-acetylglucosaminyl deacetylase|nr:MAG: hypothetical protein BAJALOKI3v1_80002 [Candidatus Lokiarchaeota archaeon]